MFLSIICTYTCSSRWLLYTKVIVFRLNDSYEWADQYLRYIFGDQYFLGWLSFFFSRYQALTTGFFSLKVIAFGGAMVVGGPTSSILSLRLYKVIVRGFTYDSKASYNRSYLFWAILVTVLVGLTGRIDYLFNQWVASDPSSCTASRTCVFDQPTAVLEMLVSPPPFPTVISIPTPYSLHTERHPEQWRSSSLKESIPSKLARIAVCLLSTPTFGKILCK